MKKEGIGGFLEIELRKESSFHPDALALNSCRNALRFLVEKRKAKRVYIAYYTCDAVYEALTQLPVEILFYQLDEELLPLNLPSTLEPDTLLLYTHYWGLCEKQIELLLKQYGESVVIDAAQAFFYRPPQGINAINSCRKFFGVPDGGYLYGNFSPDELEEDFSYKRCAHLLKRFECGPESAYPLYQKAESVMDDLAVGRMSKLTTALLGGVDYAQVIQQRRANFSYLHGALGEHNLLDLDASYTSHSVPMVYPYKCKNRALREQLLGEKIYVAIYWPNVLEWCDAKSREYELAVEVIPLPIDQRYGEAEMDKIIKTIINSQK